MYTGWSKVCRHQKYIHYISVIYRLNIEDTHSGVRVIASRILHEIRLLILAIRRTNLTLIVRLGTKSELL